MRSAMELLGLDSLDVVYPGTRTYVPCRARYDELASALGFTSRDYHPRDLSHFDNFTLQSGRYAARGLEANDRTGDLCRF